MLWSDHAPAHHRRSFASLKTQNAMWHRVKLALAQETQAALLWLPVGLSLGIMLYFTRPVEPPLVIIFGAAFAAIASFVGARILRSHAPVHAIGLAVFSIILGFTAAGARSYMVAAPVLDTRYYGPVEGRIVAMDRSSKGALRVTLSQVRLGQRSHLRTPAFVRVSLYGSDADIRPPAGAVVMTTAHLSPPNGPAEPGGFDFQRHAWFQQLGGVGYTRVPLFLVEPPQSPPGFFGLRIALSDRVRAVLTDQIGAFAAALMSGDRSALSQETLRDLRETNLAHLLAISGLHMGLLVGVVFGTFKLCFTCIPNLRHSVWTARLAALGAMGAATMYLGLSGGSVATERAFIMAMVGLGAVLLGRRVISLRSVALAATALLLWQPEALLGPGFQMSFAATTALVVVFRRLAARPKKRMQQTRIWKVIEGAVVSSAIAGLATLPVAMAHFNQIAHYGLVANIVCVPLMGIWIMPLAILSVVLMPIGLEFLPLQAMGFGLSWILDVAGVIADWPGAVSKVVSPPMPAFACLMLGLVAFALLQTKLRFAALSLIFAGVVSWANTTRPDLLISDTGQLVGILTPEGRALSRETGASFVASIWLENDGDASEQWQAAKRWGGAPVSNGRLAGAQVAHYRGKRGLAVFETCAPGDIVILSEPYEGTALCDIYDATRINRTGAVALFVTRNGTIREVTTRDTVGARLWNVHSRKRRDWLTN